MRVPFYIVVSSILLTGCVSTIKPSISQEPFGTLSSGEQATLYHLENSKGHYVDVTDYGCRIVRICVPDKKDLMDDVIVGYGSLGEFETGVERFFGAVLGRYANRIEDATFSVDGKTYHLTPNEKFGERSGHLHGGIMGFDRVMWKGETISNSDKVGIRFSRTSPSGEEGYPGNLDCSVTYWWDNNDVLRIEYKATTDSTTVICMSNHSYFNPKGQSGGSVLDLQLFVDADWYSQNNERYVPDKILSVEGSPFDQRVRGTKINHGLDIPNKQLELMKGYSVCWTLNRRKLDPDNRELAFAADVYDENTGRYIEVWTSEPSLLVYTGRGLNSKSVGKDGKPMEKFGGMILETIHSPNSPNIKELCDGVILRPGETYKSETEYRFGVR